MEWNQCPVSTGLTVQIQWNTHITPPSSKQAKISISERALNLSLSNNALTSSAEELTEPKKKIIKVIIVIFIEVKNDIKEENHTNEKQLILT